VKTNGHNISSKQERLIAALLTSGTIQQAATVAGVSETTAWRWLHHDAAFIAAYRAARREAVQQAIARLQQVSTHAVFILASVMADKATPASVRVAAASKILDLALRAVELEDVEARLSALEAAQQVKQ